MGWSTSWTRAGTAAPIVRQSTHEPAAFRAPLGAIEDSFYQAAGRRLYDASSITSQVLIVRSERDFWSRPDDVANFSLQAQAVATTRLSRTDRCQQKRTLQAVNHA